MKSTRWGGGGGGGGMTCVIHPQQRISDPKKAKISVPEEARDRLIDMKDDLFQWEGGLIAMYIPEREHKGYNPNEGGEWMRGHARGLLLSRCGSTCGDPQGKDRVRLPFPTSKRITGMADRMALRSGLCSRPIAVPIIA